MLSLRSTATIKILAGVLVVLAFTPLIAHAQVAGWLYVNMVLPVFGVFLGISAVVLDWAITEFVIGFGNQFSGTDIGVVVERTWAIVRDLFNLTFIFGLVYIGFKMILRTDDGQTRRWLINIIIAALLVNFSLFITKFVVDVSNILAVEILNYGAVANGPIEAVFEPDTDTGEIDIAAGMMNQIYAVTAINVDFTGASSDETDYSSIGFSMVFGSIMLFLVSMFVFISAGILLLIRAAVLIVLMIVSPFLFIGFVLPMFAGAARSLWKKLFSQAFLAPIYFLLLYISMAVLAGYGGQGDLGAALSGADGASRAAATAGSFGPFLIAIVFMLFSLIVAKKLGAEGANTVMNVGNRLQRGARRQVGNMSLGGTARLARSTVGAGANAAAKSKTLRRLATSDHKYGKYIARPAGQAALRASNKVAESSFDARNVAGLGAATGLGTGKKGGFKADVKQKTEDKKRMSELIGTRDVSEEEERAYENEMETKAEQFAAMKDQTEGTLAGQIKSLENSIEVNQNQLSLGEDDTGKVLTPKERAEKEAILKSDKQKLEATKEVQAERKAIEDLTKSINELNDKESQAKNPQEAAQFRAQAQAAQAEKTSRQATLDTGAARYEHQATNAESELKYQDQVNYMKALEDTAQLKQNIANILSGGAIFNSLVKKGPNAEMGASAGTIGGAASVAATPWIGATAGAGAGLAVGAGAATAGSAYADREVIAELKKRLGGNAKEMAEKDKSNKRRKEFTDIIKEVSEENKTTTETPPKTDDDNTT